MKYVMFLALSAVAAVLFQVAYPKVSANAEVAKYSTSYAGRTAALAGTIFGVLLAAAFLMRLVGKGSAAVIPAVAA